MKINPIVRLLSVMCIALLSLLTSCMSESPDRFFQVAVLNSNLLHDFHPQQFGKELEQNTIEFPDMPSSKKKGNEAEELVKTKVLIIEKAIKDISNLHPADDEMKAIQKKSLEMFRAALPAFQNEYAQLAKLYDGKAPDEQKAALLRQVSEKYVPTVDKLYNELMEKGKPFATKHQLQVNWGN